MKEKQFGPEEIIYDVNETIHTLYFIMKGNIDVSLPIKN